MMDTATRKITIDPITRVEGHGKVTLHFDEADNLTQARMHIVEFRGFERFIQGRPYWEAPVVVQRLCGICPISHHLAGAKAMDRIAGVDEIPPTALKMRLLMHHGQFLQSHALHFFHLASPDLLFGFGAPVAKRNVLGVAGEYPELAKKGILLRKFGQEIIQATAGKKIHGTGAIPGGINKNLSIEERDRFLGEIQQIIEWANDSVGLARDYTEKNLEELSSFAAFDSNHLSIVGPDGAFDIYDGNLRARDSSGNTIFDQVSDQSYHEYIGEEVRSWSYMKFPFIKSLGPLEGWYRVGPLARINNCDYIDTPQAEAARKEFVALTDERPNNLSMAYHWARMIELLHSAEKIEELLNDNDLQGSELKAEGKERRLEGIGVIEAPRGTLFHHYRINEQDQIVMANLIVSTTSNNEPMNRAVEAVAKSHLAGKSEISEGLLNHVEVAIRAYDPCLSCATHAMGQMPLILEAYDHRGRLVARRVRE